MGRFTVRLPDTLHRELESRAELEGVSLNQYVLYALTQAVTPAYTIQVLPDVEIQRQTERFDALLKQLGEPNRSVAHEYLLSRETTEVDEATEQLISRVQDRIAEASR